MGRGRHDQLERLIGEVSRGERDVASIRDQRVREAVRIALRLHREAPQGPGDHARSRIRRRVLNSVRPRHASLADRADFLFEMLARPAPYIVRGVAVVVIVVSCVAGATVASADTLPDDPLYAFKVAAEDLRLALASTSEDRATVQLSIAEHRLAEAERLAVSGRVDDALVASSGYSEHVARAAAELAQLETAQPNTASLLVQLDARFTAQRTREQTLGTKLSADPVTARGGEVLATVAAPTLAPGRNEAERVAETAASVAQELVRVAETRSGERPAADASRTITPPRTADVPRATEAARSDPPRATDGPRVTEAARNAAPTERSVITTDPPRVVTPAAPAARASDRPAVEQQASNKAAEAVRKAADEARKAADQAKSGKGGDKSSPKK